jgi:hypothetical protein
VEQHATIDGTLGVETSHHALQRIGLRGGQRRPALRPRAHAGQVGP